MTNLTPKHKSALKRAIKHPEIQPILFNKVSDLFWFDAFESEGLFNPEKIPKPEEIEDGRFIVPYWPILDYLVTSSKNIDSSTPEYAKKYLNLIRTLSLYSIEENLSNGRVWWRLSQVLQNIPTEFIVLSDFELFDFWLNDKFESSLIIDELANLLLIWLKNYTDKHKEKCLKLLKILFVIREKVQVFESFNQIEVVFRAKSFRFTDKIDEISVLSGKIIGTDAVIFFTQKLEEAMKIRGGDNYSYVWRPAIENHEQNRNPNDVEDYLILALRESVSALENTSPGNFRNNIESLLENDLDIVIRIGIYTINKFFQNYKINSFNKLLDHKYLKINFKHEMWELVKSNYNNFSDKQKQKFLQLVGEIKHYRNNDEPDLYQQAEWLAAIKDDDGEAFQRYEEIVKEINVEPEHPSFSSYFSSGWIDKQENSPLSIEDLKSTKDISELVNLLNNVSINEDLKSLELEGLVSIFKKYVLSEEEAGNQLFSNIHKFGKLNNCFLHELIDAYNQIWQEEKKYRLFKWSDAWPELLAFFKYILVSKSFWVQRNEYHDAFVANRSWIVSAISRLIERGSKNVGDNRNIPAYKCMRVREILISILDNEKNADFGEMRDAVASAINSPYGHAIQALFSLALYKIREVEDDEKSKEKMWSEFEAIFDKELEKDNNFEFFTLVALYINNIAYLSEKWIKDNFDVIFNPSKKLEWICALNGLSYNNNPLRIVLDFFKKDGIYEKVLEDSKKFRTEKSFVKYGLFLYLWGEEDLSSSNSLINRLLTRNKPDELRQIVWFYRYGVKQTNKTKAQALELFPLILQQIDYESKDGKRLASYLVHWFNLIDDLNTHSIVWVKTVIPYAEVDYNSSEALEAIEKWCANYPLKSVEIWQNLFQLNPGYPYPEKTVKKILRLLVDSSLQREAKSIVSEYMRFGYYAPNDWLNEILNKQ